MSYATQVQSLLASTSQAGATQPATGYTGTVGALATPLQFPVLPGGTVVETVGAGKEFSTIAAAVNAAPSGAVIEVQAGTYTNDFATISRNMTLIGVGGIVNMVATVPPTNLKGIITVDASTTIENFSFSGAAIDAGDGGNGAGIRYEGGNMVLTNDTFTNNQDGLLAFPVLGLPSNTIVLNQDTFNHNGSGSGYTHNAYIGAVDSLTVTNSLFEGAVVGHELKSRALVNTIVNNSFYDGPTGTASYDIDLPDGGQDVVKNNTIEKGPDAENNAMIHFGGEGIPYAGSSLLVQGNAFVDDKGGALGVLNQTAISSTITGNTFLHMTGGQIEQGPATETNNWDGAGNEFPDGSLVGVLPGSTLVYTDSAAHAVALDGSNGYLAVEGGGGLLTVTATIGHIVVIGGSGGVNYTELYPSGGDDITTAAGAKDVVNLNGEGQDTLDSEGDDAINTVGGGNITGDVNGTSTIVDGAGSNTWSIGGTTAITSVNANEFISVGSAGNLTVVGVNQYLQISDNGGNVAYGVNIGGTEYAATLDGGSFGMRTYGGASNITTGGGATGVAMTLYAGVFAITSVGADVIKAGAANATVIVEGAAKVYAGTGQLSVFGRGDSAGAQVYAAGGAVTLDGDTGNITYYGGSLANMVQSMLSNDTFVGGSGLMTINGGSREMITGGAGGVAFNADGGGGNTVTTAAGAADTLNLSGSDTVYSYGTDAITTTGIISGVIYGKSSIAAGSANVSLTLAGADTLTSTGWTQLSVVRGAAANITVSGSTYAYETGATLAYANVGGGDNDRVTLSGGAASASSSPASAIVVNTVAGVQTTAMIGSGNVAVYSNSNDLIHAGTGADYIQADAKGATIWGGTSVGSYTAINDADWAGGDAVTVYGGAGALFYNQGPAALTFIGGSGAATINGEYGSLAVQGGSGRLTIYGGDAGMHFIGGSGTTTIYGDSHGDSIQFGTGATTVYEAAYGAPEVFTFVGGHASAPDVISGFRTSTDQIDLHGVTIRSETVLVAGSVGITLSDGRQITLTGLNTTNGLVVHSV